MNAPDPEDRVILNLEMVNRLNARGCPACGRKFSLGDPVVMACGHWEDGSRYIHENEAVYERSSACWFERGFYDARRGR